MMATPTLPTAHTSSRSWLSGLNFFLADVRDGLGPFLGVLLASHGWRADDIGYVMATGGVAGMLAITPMGALMALMGCAALACLWRIHPQDIDHERARGGGPASRQPEQPEQGRSPAPSILRVLTDSRELGLLGVALPGLVAGLLRGTGHVNAGLGAVMAIQGAGAAMSPALAGWIAHRFGYSAAFVALGIVAAIGLLTCRFGLLSRMHPPGSAGAPLAGHGDALIGTFEGKPERTEAARTTACPSGSP